VRVFAVMHERAVVRYTGEELGSGEFFVHDRPPNTPVSPNTPQKDQSSGIHELAGAVEDAASLHARRATAGTMRM
jgi:hypothetical protein